MAAKFAQIEIHGAKDLQRIMRNGEADFKNMSVANHKLAIDVFKFIQRNFRTEGGEVGGWKPLAMSTLQGISRTSRGGMGKKSVALSKKPKILQKTGALRNEWKMLWTRFRMAIQSVKEYSKYHDQQTEWGGKKSKRLPQRRILPTKREAVDMADKIYKIEVQKKLDAIARATNTASRITR